MFVEMCVVVCLSVLLFRDLTNIGMSWHILGSTTFRVVETLVKVLYLWIPWGTYEGVPTVRVGTTNSSECGHGSTKRLKVQHKRPWNLIFFNGGFLSPCQYTGWSCCMRGLRFWKVAQIEHKIPIWNVFPGG
jgi:hypothetical protein